MLDKLLLNMSSSENKDFIIIIIRDFRWSATYQNNNNNNNPKPETGTTCVTCSSNICWKPALI